MRRTKTWVYGPMGWIGSVHCGKFRCDFMVRTCGLIAPKYYEALQNMSLGSNGVDWFCSLRKILMRLRGTNFALVAPVQPILYWASCSNKTIQNASKHYETHQNMSLGPNGVDRVHSLRKILMRLRGKIFCINCTSLAHFAPSFVNQRNYPKCTQTLRNAARHEFRVQWSGSGAFVAKNSKTTSWHKLVH